MEAKDSVYNGSRANPLWTWEWFGFFKYLHYVLLASGASQKKSLKTTFGPPLLPIKYPHKTPPLTNLRGGGPDPRSPPLDPRMDFYLSIIAWKL